MRNVFLFTFLFIANISDAQYTMANFFNNRTQVVLLGLDFTQCRFIGTDAFRNHEGLKIRAIKEWNRFFASEQKKYTLKRAFGLNDKYYYNSINYFLKRNDKIHVPDIVTDKPYELFEEEVIKNVATYDTFEKEGLAVTLVVESFDKLSVKATVWVCYLSLPDNEIIHMEKMEGRPSGVGQLFYWAGAVHDILGQIEDRAEELKKL